jgi:hypothetical protein
VKQDAQHRRRLAGCGREAQRRATAGVSRVHSGAGAKQQRRQRLVAVLRSAMQRRAACVVAQLHQRRASTGGGRSVLQQKLSGCGVALNGCNVKGRVAKGCLRRAAVGAGA